MDWVYSLFTLPSFFFPIPSPLLPWAKDINQGLTSPLLKSYLFVLIAIYLSYTQSSPPKRIYPLSISTPNKICPLCLLSDPHKSPALKKIKCHDFFFNETLLDSNCIKARMMSNLFVKLHFLTKGTMFPEVTGHWFSCFNHLKSVSFENISTFMSQCFSNNACHNLRFLCQWFPRIWILADSEMERVPLKSQKTWGNN